EINFVVPTGNFGNILAAYYAYRMGVPIHKLICASNENKVLYDFFKTGVYDRNRDFVLTSSPSMDILISSNLERLVAELAGDKTAEPMEQLKETGKYELPENARKAEALQLFEGEFASEEEMASRIRELYEKEGYVLDPHTAVASAAYEKYRERTGDETCTVIASTASPYKFTRAVLTSIDDKYASMDDFDLFPELEKLSGTPIPKAIDDIIKAPVKHDTVCDKDKLIEEIEKIYL
ncbi:MAG: pyridoxal-phosphate dependent enzyme, partial [Lachnospiraceae bacterium]|nr:pyridoxal-phosphate dependent enzyme [Lachnospiraceae bacterium]